VRPKGGFGRSAHWPDSLRSRGDEFSNIEFDACFVQSIECLQRLVDSVCAQVRLRPLSSQARSTSQLRIATIAQTQDDEPSFHTASTRSVMSRAKAFDPYGGRDPRELPAYTLVEAGHYLSLAENTLRAWTYGRPYASRTGVKRRKPLIVPADRTNHLLSFVNLLELHVISGIRREHQIDMRKVRQAIDTLERKFRSAPPLIAQDMVTDGTDIFVEELGELVNLNQEGQRAMRDLLEAHLKRIEGDEAGLAVRLYPFTRRPSPYAPRLVSIDPRVAFGRPVVAGSRVPTAEIADRFKAGDSFEDLVAEYDCSPAEIQEALRCELERAA